MGPVLFIIDGKRENSWNLEYSCAVRLNIDLEFPCWWQKWKEDKIYNILWVSLLECFSLGFRGLLQEEPCYGNPGQVVSQGPGNSEQDYSSKNFPLLFPVNLCHIASGAFVLSWTSLPPLCYDSEIWSLIHFSSRVKVKLKDLPKQADAACKCVPPGYEITWIQVCFN